jgi:methylenetetrahydrofolate reductase (NADPH)
VARIRDLLDEVPTSGPTASFEFFPPKTDEGDRNLRDTLNELEPLGPSFVSVTYGAGGSTRDRTHRIVVDILERTSMTPMAHLTSVAHTRDELRGILERYRDAGVENILALRGDPPRDDPDAFHELEHAIELVELAREVGGEQFSIGVAAHPEVHPQSTSREEDRRHLAAKLSEADFGITQFFFSCDDYTRMLDELDELGCDTPVIPGIMPVTNVGQIVRFAELSGAAFPADLAERLHAVEDDPAEVRRIGVEVATELCVELLECGAPGLHFYTLNRSRATREIHANLGLTRAPAS